MMLYDGSHTKFTAWKRDLRYRTKAMVIRAGGMISTTPSRNTQYPSLELQPVRASDNAMTSNTEQSSGWQVVGGPSQATGPPSTPPGRLRRLDPLSTPFIPSRTAPLISYETPQRAAYGNSPTATQPADGGYPLQAPQGPQGVSTGMYGVVPPMPGQVTVSSPLPTSPMRSMTQPGGDAANLIMQTPVPPQQHGGNTNMFDSPNVRVDTVSPSFPVHDVALAPIVDENNPIDYSKLDKVDQQKHIDKALTFLTSLHASLTGIALSVWEGLSERDMLNPTLIGVEKLIKGVYYQLSPVPGEQADAYLRALMDRDPSGVLARQRQSQ